MIDFRRQLALLVAYKEAQKTLAQKLVEFDEAAMRLRAAIELDAPPPYDPTLNIDDENNIPPPPSEPPPPPAEPPPPIPPPPLGTEHFARDDHDDNEDAHEADKNPRCMLRPKRR